MYRVTGDPNRDRAALNVTPVWCGHLHMGFVIIQRKVTGNLRTLS